MPKYKNILFFALRFMVIYGVLITPWPGMKSVYASYFGTLGTLVFAQNDGPRQIQFQPRDDHNHVWPKNFDTEIILANRDLPDSQGKPKAFMLTVDAWQMGWTPTVFLVSLILATPIPWRRQLRAILWGMLWIHGFIFWTVGIFIWNESTRLSLVTLTPFWKEIANHVEELALNPVGPSFFAAALVFILVTFRRQDLTMESHSKNSKASRIV